MAELEITGGAAGTSTATGNLIIKFGINGASISTSTASGELNIGLAASGNSVGASTASGFFMMKFGATGSAVGVTSATGVMNVAKVASGSSPGTSTSVGNLEEGLQINLNYVGTQELGIESSQGSKFDIILSGNFSTLSVTMNDKTLTYTDSVIGQTIIIDNVNMIVEKDGVNALENLSGDIDSFLKLVPGDNLITITKTGGDCSVLFDFSPMWI